MIDKITERTRTVADKKPGNVSSVPMFRHVPDERAIREATYSGRLLGCADFVARLESATNKKLAAGRPGRPKKEVRVVGSAASA